MLTIKTNILFNNKIIEPLSLLLKIKPIVAFCLSELKANMAFDFSSKISFHQTSLVSIGFEISIDNFNHCFSEDDIESEFEYIYNTVFSANNSELLKIYPDFCGFNFSFH